MKEGYSKFSAAFVGAMTLEADALEGLNCWRERLRVLGMVGAFEAGELAGVGFGNLSQRAARGFLITATRTGQLPLLTIRDYCEVVSIDLERNTVSFLAMGNDITPSAECMTHGALYEADAEIGAVIHVHHNRLWRRLLNRYPTSSPDADYGTPAMARELRRLYQESELPRLRVAAMGGHEDGVIALGRDIDEAGKTLLKAYRVAMAG
jgi:ribulose-5-phosphate 4-epimerase/fuculose-1-phosphate aldolase